MTESLTDKTWDESQAKILTINFNDIKDEHIESEIEFRASNIIFEGAWIIFYDVEAQRIRAFPYHRIDGVMSQ